MMNRNLPEIILFGLSADMPHQGHVEWISTLKKKFPTSTIVVMPCNANPLGKKDTNGHLIYPSNGFIRWQMLYEYYKKHDSEIIVSQYEIAINIPSKTYTSIEYLRYTTISEIEKQRGYILPKKYPKESINNVSIVIGTDIIFEFDQWYNWQKILKIAKVLVINRAGFAKMPNLFQQISNPKLKSAFIKGFEQGSIIEINGPQINISSRELKNFFQKSSCTNYANDFLLKYIPKDIFEFIKKNQYEFANSYFQNPKAYETYELAMLEYQKAINIFDSDRKTKLKAFIADFAKMANIDKYQTEGYKLIEGQLDIDLVKLNHTKFNHQIKKWMQQNACTWYATQKPSGKIISPKEFHANFKLLGKFGPNLAVDIIIFIKDTNAANIDFSTLKLLTIKRNDKQQTMAIPGGFYQDSGDKITTKSIFKTAVHEFLEECFSNGLFAHKSDTSKLINKKYKTQLPLLYAKIIKILKASFKAKTAPKAIQQLIGLPKKAYEKILNLPDNPSPFIVIDTILNLVSYHYANSGHGRAIVSKLKCDFYITLLPEQYQKLNEFLFRQGNLSPEEPGLTNPRNTNLAWMTIRCVSLIVTKEAWQNLLKTCGLKLSGGDDAANATIIPLIKFLTNKSNPFIPHKYSVLRELSKIYEKTEVC